MTGDAEIVPFVFNHDQQTTPIRTLKLDGKPWFVDADVCRALGVENNRLAVRRLKPEEKGVYPIYTPGGIQQMGIINRNGLTRLVMRSDKPQAVAFQDWIIEEVIPAILNTGKYELPMTAAGPQQPDLLEALNDLRTDVKYIRGKLDGGRQGFSKADLRYVGEGLAKYNDRRCWYCNDAEVVDDYGQRLEGKSEIHHADGNRANNSLENCMLACTANGCHHKLTHKSDPNHIPAWRALGFADTFHTRLRQKHGLIRPPNTPAKIWEFRPMKQTNMGFPAMVAPGQRERGK